MGDITVNGTLEHPVEEGANLGRINYSGTSDNLLKLTGASGIEVKAANIRVWAGNSVLDLENGKHLIGDEDYFSVDSGKNFLIKNGKVSGYRLLNWAMYGALELGENTELVLYTSAYMDGDLILSGEQIRLTGHQIRSNGAIKLTGRDIYVDTGGNLGVYAGVYTSKDITLNGKNIFLKCDGLQSHQGSIYLRGDNTQITIYRVGYLEAAKEIILSGDGITIEGNIGSAERLVLSGKDFQLKGNLSSYLDEVVWGDGLEELEYLRSGVITGSWGRVNILNIKPKTKLVLDSNLTVKQEIRLGGRLEVKPDIVLVTPKILTLYDSNVVFPDNISMKVLTLRLGDGTLNSNFTRSHLSFVDLDSLANLEIKENSALNLDSILQSTINLQLGGKLEIKDSSFLKLNSLCFTATEAQITGALSAPMVIFSGEGLIYSKGSEMINLVHDVEELEVQPQTTLVLDGPIEISKEVRLGGRLEGANYLTTPLLNFNAPTASIVGEVRIPALSFGNGKDRLNYTLASVIPGSLSGVADLEIKANTTLNLDKALNVSREVQIQGKLTSPANLSTPLIVLNGINPQIVGDISVDAIHMGNGIDELNYKANTVITGAWNNLRTLKVMPNTTLVLDKGLVVGENIEVLGEIIIGNSPLQASIVGTGITTFKDTNFNLTGTVTSQGVGLGVGDGKEALTFSKSSLSPVNWTKVSKLIIYPKATMVVDENMDGFEELKIWGGLKVNQGVKLLTNKISINSAEAKISGDVLSSILVLGNGINKLNYVKSECLSEENWEVLKELIVNPETTLTLDNALYLGKRIELLGKVELLSYLEVPSIIGEGLLIFNGENSRIKGKATVKIRLGDGKKELEYLTSEIISDWDLIGDLEIMPKTTLEVNSILPKFQRGISLGGILKTNIGIPVEATALICSSSTAQVQGDISVPVIKVGNGEDQFNCSSSYLLTRKNWNKVKRLEVSNNSKFLVDSPLSISDQIRVSGEVVLLNGSLTTPSMVGEGALRVANSKAKISGGVAVDMINLGDGENEDFFRVSSLIKDSWQLKEITVEPKATLVIDQNLSIGQLGQGFYLRGELTIEKDVSLNAAFLWSEGDLVLKGENSRVNVTGGKVSFHSLGNLYLEGERANFVFPETQLNIHQDIVFKGDNSAILGEHGNIFFYGEHFLMQGKNTTMRVESFFSGYAEVYERSLNIILEGNNAHIYATGSIVLNLSDYDPYESQEKECNVVLRGEKVGIEANNFTLNGDGVKRTIELTGSEATIKAENFNFSAHGFSTKRPTSSILLNGNYSKLEAKNLNFQGDREDSIVLNGLGAFIIAENLKTSNKLILNGKDTYISGNLGIDCSPTIVFNNQQTQFKGTITNSTTIVLGDGNKLLNYVSDEIITEPWNTVKSLEINPRVTFTLKGPLEISEEIKLGGKLIISPNGSIVPPTRCTLTSAEALLTGYEGKWLITELILGDETRALNFNSSSFPFLDWGSITYLRINQGSSVILDKNLEKMEESVIGGNLQINQGISLTTPILTFISSEGRVQGNLTGVTTLNLGDGNKELNFSQQQFSFINWENLTNLEIRSKATFSLDNNLTVTKINLLGGLVLGSHSLNSTVEGGGFLIFNHLNSLFNGQISSGVSLGDGQQKISYSSSRLNNLLSQKISLLKVEKKASLSVDSDLILDYGLGVNGEIIVHKLLSLKSNFDGAQEGEITLKGESSKLIICANGSWKSPGVSLVGKGSSIEVQGSSTYYSSSINFLGKLVFEGDGTGLKGNYYTHCSYMKEVTLNGQNVSLIVGKGHSFHDDLLIKGNNSEIKTSEGIDFYKEVSLRGDNVLVSSRRLSISSKDVHLKLEGLNSKVKFTYFSAYSPFTITVSGDGAKVEGPLLDKPVRMILGDGIKKLSYNKSTLVMNWDSAETLEIKPLTAFTVDGNLEIDKEVKLEGELTINSGALFSTATLVIASQGAKINGSLDGKVDELVIGDGIQGVTCTKNSLDSVWYSVEGLEIRALSTFTLDSSLKVNKELKLGGKLVINPGILLKIPTLIINSQGANIEGSLEGDMNEVIIGDGMKELSYNKNALVSTWNSVEMLEIKPLATFTLDSDLAIKKELRLAGKLLINSGISLNASTLILTSEEAGIQGDFPFFELELGDGLEEMSFDRGSLDYVQWDKISKLVVEFNTTLVLNKELKKANEIKLAGKIAVVDQGEVSAETLVFNGTGSIDGDVTASKIKLDNEEGETNYIKSKVITGVWKQVGLLEVSHGSSLLVDGDLSISEEIVVDGELCLGNATLKTKTIVMDGTLKILFEPKLKELPRSNFQNTLLANQETRLGNLGSALLVTTRQDNILDLKVITGGESGLEGTYFIDGVLDQEVILNLSIDDPKYILSYSLDEQRRISLILENKYLSAVEGLNNQRTFEAWNKALFPVGSNLAVLQAKLVDSVSDPKINDELPTLAPAVSPHLLAVYQESNRVLLNGIANHSEKKMGEDLTVWGNLFCTHGHQAGKNSYEPGFTASLAGLILGAEFNLNSYFALGGGYLFHTARVDSLAHHLDMNYNHTLFVYGNYRYRRWYLQSLVNFGYANYQEEKRVLGYQVTAKYPVQTLGLNLIGGYNLFEGLSCEGGLRILHLAQSSYSDSLGQEVKGKDSNGITGVLGVKYLRNFLLPKVNLLASGYLRGTCELLKDDPRYEVRVGKEEYWVEGRGISGLGLELGLELTAKLKAYEFSVEYGTVIHSGYASHTGMLKIKYNF